MNANLFQENLVNGMGLNFDSLTNFGYKFLHILLHGFLYPTGFITNNKTALSISSGIY